MEIRHTTLPAGPVASLTWHNQTLTDWINGGRQFHLDGRVSAEQHQLGGRFSDVAVSPNGRYVVLYQKFGTRALLLVAGREPIPLHRSDYRADITPYPICLWTDPASGHTLMAHCPEQHDRLEIDDLDSGRRLSGGVSRDPAGYFHARLSVNPDASCLMSDAWVWTPWDCVGVYDLRHVFQNPTALDDFQYQAGHSRDTFYAEESFGCWQSSRRLLVTGSETAEAEDANDQIATRGTRLLPFGIASYDLGRRTYVQSIQLDHPPGVIMPVGEQHVVSFYEYPKLICLETGKVHQAWPELPTGRETGSALYEDQDTHYPIKAMDPKQSRFAVVKDGTIHVITIKPQQPKPTRLVRNPYIVTIELALKF